MTVAVGPSDRRAASRHVELGLAGLVALSRACADASLPPLPDLGAALERDPDLSLVDLAPELEAARTALVARDVLDVDAAPTDALRTQAAGFAAARTRLSVSLAGGGHHLRLSTWAADGVGGMLVRSGERCALRAFDARSWGEELLAVLPRHSADTGRWPGTEDDTPAPRAGAERSERLVVPLRLLTSVAGDETFVETLDPAVEAAARALAAELTGAATVEAERATRWREGVVAVLHARAPVLPPRTQGSVHVAAADLVWFLVEDGWWSARRSRHAGEPVVVLEPADRRGLVSALAALVIEARR
ncbi:hypothetical protein [Nocardioides bruguierae]|uniref:Uncharacterized protein n=1 Tax=Nocardioides bruguierae TaxID=2945102 RepID=A0A9X2D8T6_9ACTN|nr:hypothetical protein [Nocardioides bruguierae]MCM0621260.1 hypothetical protein [Nocardioides bruguierae]